MIIAGADSSAPITQHQFDFAVERLGAAPVAWGRYFNGRHAHPAEYVAGEAGFFRARHLKLVPLAQQTTEVRKAEHAAEHARMNVQKFIGRVGLDRLAANGNEYLMFLDVEDDPSTDSPVMTPEYWVNWSQALVDESRAQSGNQFTILPAIYGRHNSAATWQALAAAEDAGAERCRAVWVARAFKNGCTRPLPEWNAELDFLTVPVQCPIVLWQYAIECAHGGVVDLNLITANAADRDFLLSRLAVP
jgi:hypothetical protein